jgi:hypothetical protein
MSELAELVYVRVRGTAQYIDLTGRLTYDINEAAMFHPARAYRLSLNDEGRYELGSLRLNESKNNFELISINKIL